ncbi:hypothetical protein ACJX0J_006123, partial [Zea mays]
ETIITANGKVGVIMGFADDWFLHWRLVLVEPFVVLLFLSDFYFFYFLENKRTFCVIMIILSLHANSKQDGAIGFQSRTIRCNYITVIPLIEITT